MKTLVVLRHAEAEHGARSDHSRRLTARGKLQAAEAGDWLRSLGITIDSAVVSDAVRTTATMNGLQTQYEFVPTHDAYNAHARTLIEHVHELPSRALCAIVVAHNPGVSDLCWQLGNDHALSPASGVVARWAGEWSDFLVMPNELVSTFTPTQ